MNTTNVSVDVTASEVDSLIAQLVASYGTPDCHKLGSTSPAMVKVVRPVNKAPKMPKALKGQKIAVSTEPKAQATSIRDARPMIPGMTMPKAGTIDAKAYLTMMRRASNREERIVAIASYIGYNTAELHGAQEMNANMRANQALRGVPNTRIGCNKPTFSTFVNGTPCPLSKKHADLKAREVLTVEAVLDLERQGQTFLDMGDHERSNYAYNLAAIESERLTHIRAELASM